jgi:hypothetical protein
MSKLKGIIRKMSGSVGDLTFKSLNGATIVSEKITSVANPRTNKQMKVRTKWANIVAMYKGIRPLLNYGFENRPHNLTDYNMFVKVNMQLPAVYLTKQAVAGGACVAAPYQITQGSLPAIVLSGNGQSVATDIALGIDGISASTTVAQFASAVVENNIDYQYGDQISFFLVKQKVNADTEVPYCQFSSCKVVLDATNTDILWDVVNRNGFSSQDGHLAHSGNDGDCAYCWVHSRKSANGKTLVSSQVLVSANSILSDYQGDLAYNLASSSYGQGKSAFLTPDADAAESAGGTGGNSGGGGNGGGGNDSL